MKPEKPEPIPVAVEYVTVGSSTPPIQDAVLGVMLFFAAVLLVASLVYNANTQPKREYTITTDRKSYCIVDLNVTKTSGVIKNTTKQITFIGSYTVEDGCKKD